MTQRFWGEVPPATSVSTDEAEVLARDVFGIAATARPLGSNQETNLLLRTTDAAYVLKVANPAFGRDVLDLQNAAMRHLAGTAGLRVPVPVPAPDGSDVVVVDMGGAPHHVRLLTFVPGELLSDAGHLAEPTLRRLGGLAAHVAAGLSGFDHPAADRPLQYDPRRAAEVVGALAPSVNDPDRRSAAVALSEHAWSALTPVAGVLRTQVVHADLADYNVVAGRDREGRPDPDGVIDFGDVLRSWLVGDLATCVASLLARPRSRPVTDACAVAAGYHAVLPLTEPEVEALWPLVAARAAVLAVSADDILAADPANTYAREEQPLDWRIVERVGDVPFELAHEALRQALGLDPSSRVRRALAWRPDRPVVDPGPSPVALDLSVRTDLLPDGAWLERAAVRAAVDAALAGRPGLLRYGEGRLPDVVTDSADETPTVSLGAGLVVPAGTPVRAPADGTVRSTDHAESAGDGTVLVLACDRVDVVLGGLVPSLRPGDAVAAGDVVGAVAPAPASPALPPHVHVQVVAATGLVPPRLAAPSLAHAWRALCPDPAPLLGLEEDAPDEPGPDDVLAR
ncbi:MAG TPA: phosphotransferase, partial [Jiangellales bacterium]|nr:phosphotransferase [Jiangellales bacterium]